MGANQHTSKGRNTLKAAKFTDKEVELIEQSTKIEPKETFSDTLRQGGVARARRRLKAAGFQVPDEP